MSIVFPFGAARCIDCKAPVAIVRREFDYDCSSHGRVCHAASLSLSVVDDDGSIHACHVNARSVIMDGPEQAAQSNILNVALVSQLAPGGREPFHVGSKTT